MPTRYRGTAGAKVIFDVDDLYEGHDRMDLLLQLKEANPLFRMTAFAVTGRCSDDYIESLPDFIEPVPHGWSHGDPPIDGGECRDWTYDQMRDVIEEVEASHPRWARGWKSPGWITSDECFFALAGHSWWIADQRYNDIRRPLGMHVHVEGDGDHSHHHVQNVCGNGLQEMWPTILGRVRNATSFELISEVVRPWMPVGAVA